MTRGRRVEFVSFVLNELRLRSGNLTETAAADLVAVSSSWLRHRFRRTTGMSFRHARLVAKLECGKHLLATTESTISEISAVLGYSERSKFEKSFKRLHGITPTRYRQQLAIAPQNGQEREASLVKLATDTQKHSTSK